MVNSTSGSAAATLLLLSCGLAACAVASAAEPWTIPEDFGFGNGIEDLVLDKDLNPLRRATYLHDGQLSSSSSAAEFSSDEVSGGGGRRLQEGELRSFAVGAGGEFVSSPSSHQSRHLTQTPTPNVAINADDQLLGPNETCNPKANPANPYCVPNTRCNKSKCSFDMRGTGTAPADALKVKYGKISCTCVDGTHRPTAIYAGVPWLNYFKANPKQVTGATLISPGDCSTNDKPLAACHSATIFLFAIGYVEATGQFINLHNLHWPAFHMEKYSEVTVKNMLFQNNHGHRYGGLGFSRVIGHVVNSKFINNNCPDHSTGPEIGCHSSGIYVTEGSRVDVSGSYFKGNIGEFGTMMVTGGSAFTMNTSTFIGNKVSVAGSFGGAIFHDMCIGTISEPTKDFDRYHRFPYYGSFIDSCIFEDNFVPGFAGAIMIGSKDGGCPKFKVTNSQFIHNTVEILGPAVSLRNCTRGKMHFNKCLFKGNINKKQAGIATISVEDPKLCSVEVAGSKFQDGDISPIRTSWPYGTDHYCKFSVVGKKGGGLKSARVYCESKDPQAVVSFFIGPTLWKVYHTQFLDVLVPQNQPTAYIQKDVSIILDGRFKSYTFEGSFTGISNQLYPAFSTKNTGAGSVMRNMLFQGNTGKQFTAAFNMGKGVMTIANSRFIGNACTSNKCHGGAIFVQSGAALTIKGSTFTGNQGHFGGAIRLTGNALKINIKGNTFNKNVVPKGGGGGGAIQVQKITGSLSITNNVFDHNSAVTSGGGALLLSLTKSATIKGNTFTNNYAFTTGAAVSVSGCGGHRLNIKKQNSINSSNKSGYAGCFSKQCLRKYQPYNDDGTC